MQDRLCRMNIECKGPVAFNQHIPFHRFFPWSRKRRKLYIHLQILSCSICLGFIYRFILLRVHFCPKHFKVSAVGHFLASVVHKPPRETDKGIMAACNIHFIAHAAILINQYTFIFCSYLKQRIKPVRILYSLNCLNRQSVIRYCLISLLGNLFQYQPVFQLRRGFKPFFCLFVPFKNTRCRRCHSQSRRHCGRQNQHCALFYATFLLIHFLFLLIFQGGKSIQNRHVNRIRHLREFPVPSSIFHNHILPLTLLS